MNAEIQDTPLTMGQVARQAGVGVETVRFYERQGIIDEPPGKDPGYRLYPNSPVDRYDYQAGQRTRPRSIR